MRNWTAADIPQQGGKLAIVTGTGGLGFETALALARAGAEVVLAGRDPAKGEHAVSRIKAATGAAAVSFAQLDLADLASIVAFARTFAARHGRLDILINNAGVMALPARRTTADGFEMQFGTNVLGPFALTGHLLPLLSRSGTARVVQLSSLAHRRGRVDFDDLHGERRYDPWKAYCQSKLAMLIFALELQRRSDAGGWGLISLAAHPGWATSDLIANGPANGRSGASGFLWRLVPMLAPMLSQSTAAGALPTLYAATAAEVAGAGFYGPDGLHEVKGLPAPAKIVGEANDRAVATRLWDVAERSTGSPFCGRDGGYAPGTLNGTLAAPRITASTAGKDKSMSARFWGDLKTTEFAGLDAGKTVAVLPLAAIEQHGPHLPVSVDTAIMNAMLGLAMPLVPADLDVLVLPTMAVCKSNEHLHSPGTLTLGWESAIRSWIEIGESVKRAGLAKLVIVTSHGGNIDPMKVVARELRVRRGMMAVTTAWRAFGLPPGFFADLDAHHGIHGGDIETSLMLHFRPDLVDMTKASLFKPSTVTMAEEGYAWLRPTGLHAMAWMAQDVHPSGAAGDASLATAKKGKATAELQAKGFIELLADVARFPQESLFRVTD